MSQVPAHSRVWIFQSDRALTPDEIKWLAPRLASYIEGWKAHGASLAAAAEIRYNRFIIIMVDEAAAQASGCSIDNLHHFMQEVEKHLGINLFDRFNIAYKENGQVLSASRTAFEQLLQEGKVTEETTVFNNLVQNKAELDTGWEVPLKNSWHKQVFMQV